MFLLESLEIILSLLDKLEHIGFMHDIWFIERNMIFYRDRHCNELEIFIVFSVLKTEAEPWFAATCVRGYGGKWK